VFHGLRGDTAFFFVKISQKEGAEAAQWGERGDLSHLAGVAAVAFERSSASPGERKPARA